MSRVRPPVPDRDDAFFWDGAAAGRLLIQRCAECATLRHPPGPMCARCGSLDWDTVEASGRGTVLSWIVSHHPTETDVDPRIVVLVELQEGTRLVANLVDVDPGATVDDMAVTVTFVDYDGTVMPQFSPAEPSP